MSVADAATNLKRVLGGTPYGRYTIGNAVSLTGTWMQRISVGWLTWQMTESGTWLGLMAFADLFPALIVGPLAGAAADRWDRIMLMRLAQLGGLAVASAIALLYLLSWLDLWLLFLLSALLGVFASAAQPLRMSVVSVLVPREDMHVAVAVNSMTFNVARFCGPAVASLLIVTVGIGAAFIVHALTYAVFVMLLRPLSAPSERRLAKHSVLEEIVEGIVYLVAHRGLGPVMVLVIALGTFLRPVAELLPGFAEQVFSSGAGGLALLSTSIGVGALAGSVVSAGQRQMDLLNKILASVALAAASLFGFAMTHELWLGAVFLFAAGAAMTSAGIANQTVIHLTVPEEIRGRTLSSYGVVLRVGPALGALGIGYVSDWIGLQMALLVPLPLCLLMCGVVYVRRPVISRCLNTMS